MTHTQYNNTVRDLFPGAAIPPQTILVDPKVNGFENNSEVQTPSALLVEQYQKAALAVTAAAMATPTFLPCPADGGPDPAGCGHTFLRDLAARAFRRPLAPDEESAYLDFFDQQMAEHNFNVGLQLAMQAILQAPPFIYFPEFGGDALADQPALVQLTGHELAARLSYFLWDTTPDELLLSAAAGGDLDTIDGIEAEVLRMLADPRARSSLVNFHRQWFDLDKIAEVNPDPATHPDFTPTRSAARCARRSTSFVESTIFDGAGSFSALLTSTATTVDPSLAALYNVAAHPAEHLGRRHPPRRPAQRHPHPRRLPRPHRPRRPPVARAPRRVRPLAPPLRPARPAAARRQHRPARRAGPRSTQDQPRALRQAHRPGLLRRLPQGHRRRRLRLRKLRRPRQVADHGQRPTQSTPAASSSAPTSTARSPAPSSSPRRSRPAPRPTAASSRRSTATPSAAAPTSATCAPSATCAASSPPPAATSEPSSSPSSPATRSASAGGPTP
jgi:hypothetical protein